MDVGQMREQLKQAHSLDVPVEQSYKYRKGLKNKKPADETNDELDEVEVDERKGEMRHILAPIDSNRSSGHVSRYFEGKV